MKKGIKNDKKKAIFRKLGIATIIAVYVLILVGGIVRSTGAGMGCPDWPLCFGEWIPPTDVSQLPENYQEIYTKKRKAKNARLAKYLKNLGWNDLSKRIVNEASINEETSFHVFHTWVEYINRLVGVLIGFFVLGTLWYARNYLSTDSAIFWLSFFALILVILEGWIGSIVVSTNLLPGMITLHMLLAILIVFTLMYVVTRSFSEVLKFPIVKNRKKLNIVLLLTIILSTLQVVLGTQVREAIDMIAKSLGETNRGSWINEAGATFYIHRSFSWIVLFSGVYLVYNLRQKVLQNFVTLQIYAIVLIILLIAEIATGAMMAYFSIPAFLQPVHLLLSVVILGVQFLLLLLVNYKQIMLPKITLEEKKLEYIP